MTDFKAIVAKLEERGEADLVASVQEVVSTLVDAKLTKIYKQHKSAINKFLDTGDIPNNVYEKLFEYYTTEDQGHPGSMPYGTAKGRSGDPYQWIQNKLAQDLGK